MSKKGRGMERVNLQENANTMHGTIGLWKFKKESQKKVTTTLYHKIEIPLTEVKPDLSVYSDSIKTHISMDWIELGLTDPTDLDGLIIHCNRNENSDDAESEIEVSIYLGNAHNPCDIKIMTFKKLDLHKYEIECVLLVDFEHEDVAQNEEFQFKTELHLNPIIEDNI